MWIGVGDHVCPGFVILLAANITSQKTLGDVGDRMVMEPAIYFTFRLDAIQ
jgi:hypothetical protein